MAQEVRQEVGFVRSKKKTLSPGFFPVGKERQFAPTGEPSERRQPAAEQCKPRPCAASSASATIGKLQQLAELTVYAARDL